MSGALERWRVEIADSGALADLLYRSSFQSYLGGQLFVRAIELAPEAGEPGTVTLSAQRRDADPFLAMPFDEAVAFFRDKRVMTPAEFDAIEERFKAGGFIARGLASDRTVGIAATLIDSLLTQGLTLDEVRAELADAESDAADRLGISPAAPWYLDTVIRTNIATAYGAGRYAAITDPDVVRLRPWVQQRTAGDDRVRAGHRALAGMVFLNGGALASRYAPPLFYSCRCTQVTLSQRQFEDRGLTEQTSEVAEMEAEEFWPNAPGPLTAADV